ncbi:MAG: type II toxin-antitoxin system VapC family toxin [bacterium]
MKTAIDSSVLWCIQKEEPGHEQWQRALEIAASEGQLCICPVTFAEISPGRSNADEVMRAISLLAISYEEIIPEAAHLAGSIFLNYRRQGGPRAQMIPDFLIAAHAEVQCTHLASIDRGYLRRYFPKLKLLQP